MRRTASANISVVIPHSGRRSVAAVVESLLNQGSDNIEVIVVADGEGLLSHQLLKTVDRRLRVFEKPREGANAARNFGLARASNDWVAFVDDDDIPRSNWMATWQGLIDSGVLAATAATSFWRHGRFERERQCSLSLEDPTMDASKLLAGAFVVRRELLAAVGGYDPQVAFGENQDLGLRLIQHVVSAGVPGRVARTDSVVIDVMVEDSRIRSKRHGDSQAASVALFLERYADRIRADRSSAQAYGRILARSARRRGDFKAAFRHAYAAVRLNPRKADNMRALAMSVLALSNGVSSRATKYLTRYSTVSRSDGAR